MTNEILNELYEICLHDRADNQFINRLSAAFSRHRDEEPLTLIDSLAKFIAEEFLTDQLSFDNSDRAINNLAGYVIYTDQIPELTWKIYLAFDDAEIDQDGSTRLRTSLRDVLDAAEYNAHEVENHSADS